jgi:hypothetical protein
MAAPPSTFNGDFLRRRCITSGKTNPKPLHLLQQVDVQDTIQAPDGAPRPPLTVY